MKSEKKIMLFTIGLFFLVILSITLVIYHQANQLQRQQHEVVESAYLATKQNELKNYLSIARLAIAHLSTTELDHIDIKAQEEAKNILRKLKFDGNDGYYFIHDFDCKNILQPPDPDREGKYECDRTDRSGKQHIKELIDIARTEGEGFVHYDVIKPTSGEITPKLSYVQEIPEWKWVLGNGIYLDDVDHVLNGVDTELSHYIHESMKWIVVITLLGLLALSAIQIRIGKMIGGIIALENITTKLHDNVKQESAFIIREIGNSLEKSSESSNASSDLYLLKKVEASAQRSLKWIRAFIAGEDPNNPALVDGLNEVIECFKEREENIAVYFSPSIDAAVSTIVSKSENDFSEDIYNDPSAGIEFERE